MNSEIHTDQKELSKLSREFRTVAARLLKTEFNEGMSNLKRFLNFINNSPIISEFIQKNNVPEFDIKKIISDPANCNIARYKIPDDSTEKEISFIFQLLSYGLEKYKEDHNGYYSLAKPYSMGKSPQESVKLFNKSIVHPLAQYIENYLTNLQIDNGYYENSVTQVNIEGNNYGNHIGDNGSVENVDQKNSTIGVGVNKEAINTENLAGNLSFSPQTNEIID